MKQYISSLWQMNVSLQKKWTVSLPSLIWRACVGIGIGIVAAMQSVTWIMYLMLVTYRKRTVSLPSMFWGTCVVGIGVGIIAAMQSAIWNGFPIDFAKSWMCQVRYGKWTVSLPSRVFDACVSVGATSSGTNVAAMQSIVWNDSSSNYLKYVFSHAGTDTFMSYKVDR